MEPGWGEGGGASRSGTILAVKTSAPKSQALTSCMLGYLAKQGHLKLIVVVF